MQDTLEGKTILEIKNEYKGELEFLINKLKPD